MWPRFALQAGLVGRHPGPHLFETLEQYQVISTVAFGLSIGLSVLSIVLVPIAIARLPQDYFVRGSTREGKAARHPTARLLGRAAKNLLGGVMLLTGIAMLVLPGQGLLTIVVSLVLLDFPGKHRLEERLVRQRHVRRAMAFVRKRAGKPPLRFSSREPPGGDRGGLRPG